MNKTIIDYAGMEERINSFLDGKGVWMSDAQCSTKSVKLDMSLNKFIVKRKRLYSETSPSIPSLPITKLST
jgi:galactitol-specific phosphotransferase system IIB component